MTPATFRNTRQSFDLTVEQWSRILGCTARGVRKWESGENNIPGPVRAFCQVLRMLPKKTQQACITQLLEQLA